MNTEPAQPCSNEAPKTVRTVTVRPDALTRVRKDVLKLEGAALKSRQNLRVRDRWRALSLALEEVQPGEPLRVQRQHADYYFTPRDAVMESVGFPSDPFVRCLVCTPSGLVFWVLKSLLKPLPKACSDAADHHASTSDGSGDIGAGVSK